MNSATITGNCESETLVNYMLSSELPDKVMWSLKIQSFDSELSTSGKATVRYSTSA